MAENAPIETFRFPGRRPRRPQTDKNKTDLSLFFITRELFMIIFFVRFKRLMRLALDSPSSPA